MAAKKKAATPPPAEPATTTKLAAPEPPPKPQVHIGKGPGEHGKEITLHKLDQVTHSLERLIPNILLLEAAAGRAKITNEEDYNKGSTFLSSCDRQWDQIEALRKAVKGPIDDYAKLIQATFMPYLRRLEVAKAAVNQMMKTFYLAEEQKRKDEQARIRREQEEKAQQIAQQHEAAGNTDVANAVLEAAISAPPPATQVSLGKTVNALGEKTVVRRVWRGQVADQRVLLQAILDGKVPWVVIEFKQAELNTVARQISAEGTIHGIKVTHDVDLGQRA